MKTLLIAFSFAFATASFASNSTTTIDAQKTAYNKALTHDIGENDPPKDQNPKPKG